MQRIIKKGKKRSYKLDKIKVEDFVRLGLGTEDEFYKLTGKKKPVKKDEPKKEEKKEAASK